ncbi:iron-containing alcohol dehydrogenase [Verrucomicrobia bacterium]|nr:iron-containing alcohol dehydrogenase [Verrucomicrobiota bacterium]
MLQLRLPIPRFMGAGEILHGSGSLSALRMLDGVRVAVLASATVLKHHQAEIERAINHLKLSIIEYPGGEPDLAIVSKVSAELSKIQPNWIVAIGGGSVLDGAKLAWIFYEHPDAELNLLVRPFALRRLRGRSRFVAVPTTAGTGSEVSSAAVISDAVTGRKQAIVSHELIPDIAILDPRLTVNVPASVLVSSGLDALAHSVEAYVSKFENPLADIQAEKSIEMIFRLLPQTIQKPDDLKTRMEIMMAALMAGWVQNLKVPGLGHALAHQIGQFGIPHGMACGGLLSSAITVNQRDPKVAGKYRRLAEAIGLNGLEGLNAAILDLKAKLGFSERLSVIASTNALSKDQRKLMFEGAKEDICAKANPIGVTDQILEEMMEQAW